MSALLGLLADDLCAQREYLARGAISAVELVRAQIAAIDATQPALNAFITLDRERALAEAAVSDARRKARQVRALEGVSIAVKDNLDVAHYITTAGMATRREAPTATSDSAAVARLRDAGCVILGKLNMHEAALGADNDNPHFGACHNPHRIGHTPGGSSGGSGAAVAAGLASAALGSDSMGSVRIPASYCGVVGLKPSYGTISPRGSVTVSRRLDHIGPVARSVRDLTLLLDVLAGFDPDSAESRRQDLAPRRAGTLKLGIPAFDGIALDTDVALAFDAALEVLESLGHRRLALPASRIEPGRARRAGLLVCEAEMLIEHDEAWRTRREQFSPQLAKLLAWAETKSAADFAAADRLLDRAQCELQGWLAIADVVVWPTTPQRAFAFGAPVPANQADLTCFANMAGAPAVSVPMASGAGELPIGLQFIGRIGDDYRLLGLAEIYSRAIGWRAAIPPATAALIEGER
jgi:aspartyl-tRNA(Asn)/glutamyl-tRNA(Gln) amidotransferase subunit A